MTPQTPPKPQIQQITPQLQLKPVKPAQPQIQQLKQRPKPGQPVLQ
jgi:hypothetical protein